MALFALGPLAVNGVQQKELRRKLEDWSWLLLLVGATAMVVFSGYLMWLLAFKISAVCIYCLASAAFTVLMLLLTLFGREWPDLGQVFFTGITVAIVAVVGTLMLYQSIVGSSVNAQNPNDPFVITSTSGPAELALADHLKSINAQMFGAFWCPHCHDQKQLFGKEAFSKIDYVECDPKGANARPDLCKAAKIEGFPTWHIKDKVLSGTQPLVELGKVSAYTGPQNFKNQVEGAVAPVSK
ncbi:MAG TPA: vitamin K epoxide reductase family protein, partial [Stenomitos sp.]